MNRILATLDRNRAGAGLHVDDSDLRVLCTEAVAASTILGTLPAMSGQFACEAYFWSVLQAIPAGRVALGVAQPGTALGALGDSATGYAYDPAAGTIRNNGATLATLAAQGERVALGVVLDLAPGAASCTWYANGVALHTQALPTGKAWLPALQLGAGVPGDVEAIVNFGATRFDTALLPRAGWSQGRPGVARLTLALASEGFLSDGAGGALPANTPFGPYLLDADKLAIRRRAEPWYHRGGSGRASPAALAVLRLDNGDGRFNALRDADVRDARVVLQRVAASAGRSSAVPTTLFTAIVERASEPRPGVVELTLRDTLACLDRALPMRMVPPFADDSSAGRAVPVGLGAQRNVQPLLLSTPDRTWLLGDAPMTNVPMVADMAAPLDPYATPPQYTPALDGAGLQLETLPVGRLSADCSSVGGAGQATGAVDVLAGIGDFSGWAVPVSTYTDTPPTGWSWSGGASPSGSSLMKLVQGGVAHMRLLSDLPWYAPAPHYYGHYLKTTGQPLLPGRAYRLSMRMPSVFCDTTGPAAKRGGIMLRTAISDNPADAITAHGVAVQTAQPRYVIDFRLPPATAARDLYIIGVASGGMAGGSALGRGGADIADVQLELLGQFDALPLDGITVDAALQALLVDRLGEDASIYSSADAQAIDAAAPYPAGYRWEDAPNVLDALTEIADQSGSVLFTDAAGTVRLRQITLEGDPVARFDTGCIDPDSLRIWPDTAPGLTTAFAARPNCTPFGEADFVTDTNTVPPGMRAAYTGDSQILLNAPGALAGEYSAARNAPRRRTRLDTSDALATEAQRVCALFATRRQFVSFRTYYEDSLGTTPAIAPEALLLGDRVTLHLPARGLTEQAMTVLAVDHYPGARRVDITGWY